VPVFVDPEYAFQVRTQKRKKHTRKERRGGGGENEEVKEEMGI
jgi:hypothetical protein